MARSFPNAKLISAFVAQRISVAASRRGYAAGASQGAVPGSMRGGSNANMMRKKGGEESSSKTTSWVPDPVTGYYRPETHAAEIDAAELRNMLLKHKN
ncbi:protein SENESCENCE-ASSOCIATED GENE 21, mitochondrial [Coffea eugenioides]|uniref:Protein SENESCENCE-ASSOCIATED GENE 21, mitochondrial-like n=1 Tax=Coffea arabica TaxID=13443 RepID=A0A6P6V8J6_COFAR|nr:protein SENESCENCE-ASSOCIATED GENE 21, mitochondrial-like [Coffea arabica]XP_027117950.1 protein SENESCENCE-ASSOCIATED GENE 21, mitochondrial-like [Coffea arabica]XP_027157597.1 protein SENESCENCE-ASSOCIATED GENE 21, mitochondrial [Coffea eugenioides]